MLYRIRKSKATKLMAVCLLFSLLSELLFPLRAWALTSGPSQPEFQTFTPLGTSDMVDPFSGNFNYNIPLLDIDGYPINIAYNSGITMDQEATWVGLGWNLNAGSINRGMRGVPDDFKGETIKKKLNIRTNRTFNVFGSFGAELFGVDPGDLVSGSLKYTLGASYNNYTGIAFEQGLDFGITVGQPGKASGTFGLGLRSTADGLTISPRLSFSATVAKLDKDDNACVGLGIGTSFNSRTGLKALSINASVSAERQNVKTDPAKPDSYSSLATAGTGSSISFGVQTYVPTVSMPMTNTSVTFSIKGGVHLFGLDGSGDIGGGYSEQRLSTKSDDTPAYGYLYAEDPGAQSDMAQLDFNREKDGSYNANTTNLPITNYTYDTYTVMGQGVGGSFRPFRGDINYVYDKTVATGSDSYSLGLEIGGGNLVKGGADVSVTTVDSKSGKWSDFNDAIPKLIKNAEDGGEDYESFYFKEVGEKSVETDPDFFTGYGEFDAIRPVLSEPTALDAKVTTQFKSGFDGPVSSLPSNNYRKKRAKRNQLISFLKNKDKGQAFATGTTYSIPSDAKEHHLYEISVLKPDGNRYIFGLPLYNTKQKEVTFNASGRSVSGKFVNYQDKDVTEENDNGLDNYFNSVELPAYAHSYLLTAIVSPDYVDLTGDGPSKDDIGTFTQLIYGTTSGDDYISDFNWRTPLTGTPKQANFNDRLKSFSNDDQGTYISGTKEIRYLKQIKSKNYVAIFELDDREDALGAAEDGTIDTDKEQKLLKRILLYSRPDYEKNASSAEAIKIVNFEYDYSLCPSVPNNEVISTGDKGTGKLTLKKIYFTYGSSYKGRLSPYVFHYNYDKTSFNPGYNMSSYDRWGNYKKASSVIPNDEFPYVNQDGSADNDAASWHLTSIDLPSGGTIKVDYESDDYGYVQNKQAMQMFTITNIVDDISTASPTSNNNVQKLMDGNKTNLYLIVKLHEGNSSFPKPTTATEFERQYLKGMDKLYFRFLVDMKTDGKYEYVSGYCFFNQGTKCGVITDSQGNTDYAWIQIKSTGIGDKDNGSKQVNPIAKAAWQFGRINTPVHVWDQPNVDEDGAIEQVIKAMAGCSFIKNIGETFAGPNRTILNKGYGLNFKMDHSWIRLLNPVKSKDGGGTRVKQVKIYPNWNADQNDFYGQEYNYTMNEGGNIISSGVASYEPTFGADENPWREPMDAVSEKQEERILAPDDDYYTEGPMGESFFPSPDVGYRVVEVKNIHSDLPSGKTYNRHATGKTVSEFYTAYDFPTIVKQTDIDPHPQKTEPFIELFTLKKEDNMTVSQGYSIELNDMHGKPKSNAVYAEGENTYMSKVTYVYQQDGSRLNNNITVINDKGQTSNAKVGIEFDLVADMREQKSSVTSEGLSGNLSNFLAAILPFAIPIVIPSYSEEKTRLRTTVMTKVIRRYGILSETIAEDLASKVTTKNLAYDAETGDVILTKTTNDFDDPVYSFKYPGHWAYEAMGMAYKNIMLEKELSFSAGVASVADAEKYFAAGDEVYVAGGTTKYWITNVTPGAAGTITAQNQSGAYLTGTNKIKIYRSGRRNLMSMSVGNVTTLKNPLDNFSGNVFEKVINASAQEFSDIANRTYCECTGLKDNPNKYVTGLKGNWRPVKSHLYLTERKQSRANNNTNIRRDGEFSDFSAFWKVNAGGKWLKDDNKWTWTSEVITYDPHGSELENKDALNRYSSALYGYNYTLATAVANNTEHKEIAFDAFEDYKMDNCPDDHFSYEVLVPSSPSNNTIQIVPNAHTGKNAIKIPKKQKADLRKDINPCP